MAKNPVQVKTDFISETVHSLIIGTSLSGKTTLAKVLCSLYRAKGIKTLVLDPLCDPGWDADYKARNTEEFIKVARASRRCALFIDESGKALGKYDPRTEWLTTMARHWGHKSHILCQRAEQLSVTLRDQCGQTFVFRVSGKDSKRMAQEFTDPRLEDASQLPKLHFFHCSRFSGVREYFIKMPERKIFLVNRPQVEP